METTLIQILVCQSPALFLLTLFLLICFFANHKRRQALAVVELIFSILLLILGVALYFIGIGQDVFTIHDFYNIRTAGWVGLAVVAVVTLWILIGKLRRSSAKRQEEKDSIKAANAQALAVEKARAEAFEAGRAAAAGAASENPQTDSPANTSAEETAESASAAPAEHIS
jgi:hypothetical protein